MADINDLGTPGGKTTTVGESLSSARKTVTSAGTAEALMGASDETRVVIIKALATNTGIVYIGNSGVASSNGFELAAGEGVSLHIDNSKDNIYLDVSVNGEGVSAIYW